MLQIDIYKKLKEFDLNISFTHEGRCIGIMGGSGCGKSMTLKCIAGIETPDKGRIILNDEVVFDSEKKINLKIQKRNVGYMFQNYALFDNMSVKNNIISGLKAHKLCKDEIKDKTEEMLKIFRLEKLAERFPRQLSGGQKQRTALARMIAANPDVYLLDEPFSALDSNLKDELIEEMKEILSFYNKPAILVSHDITEINRLCNKKYIMEKGEFIE